jgi:hypothetical protein
MTGGHEERQRLTCENGRRGNLSPRKSLWQVPGCPPTCTSADDAGIRAAADECLRGQGEPGEQDQGVEEDLL